MVSVVQTKGMQLVPGGSFVMGSLDFYPEEGPLRQVDVADLWVDEHPVTNAQFRRFVRDTGHVTVAEVVPDAVDFPDADPADLVAGSLRSSSGDLNTFVEVVAMVPAEGRRESSGCVLIVST